MAARAGWCLIQGSEGRTTTMWHCGGPDHDDVASSWFSLGTRVGVMMSVRLVWRCGRDGGRTWKFPPFWRQTILHGCRSHAAPGVRLLLTRWFDRGRDVDAVAGGVGL
jgi:hypothetical protein